MIDLVPGLLQEANEAKATGDLFRSEEVLREILNISPDNIVALSSLSLIAIELSQYESAIPLLTKALKIQPQNHALLYNLGLSYQGINEIDAAIYCYKSVISIKPDFSQAYNNLGIAYQHIGNIDLANLYLEKAFGINPDCIEAYYNFAQTHKFSEADGEIINKLKELARNSDLTSESIVKLEFALGKIHDDLHKFDLAFAHYQKANSLKNRGFNWEALDSYSDNIINIFNKDTTNKLVAHVEPSAKRFIFIVGMPRSGTTLIEQIISNHPLVKSGGEIGFIGDIVDELPDLLTSRVSYPECINAISNNQINQIAMRFNLFLDNMGGSFLDITDKSPINFLHIGLIKILFPQSTIIHVKRNPIATCLSCYFQNFDKQHQYSYDLNNLGHFYLTYHKIMTHWESVFGDDIINVEYEDLIKSPQETMFKLVTLCQLEWDDACSKFYNGKNIVNSASKWQTRQPIYNHSLEKWKNYEEYIGELLSVINKE